MRAAQKLMDSNVVYAAVAACWAERGAEVLLELQEKLRAQCEGK
ncbi:MAG TPA: hypothetical protein VGH19_02570 [Verrucomicrobiae bacterium]